MIINICSGYDFWSMEALNDDGDRVLKSHYWSHNDDKNGVGGEYLFKDFLEYLGHTVSIEESY